jgi:hypothetical protein
LGYKYDFSLTSERQSKMKRYILQKDMPGINKGAVFVHDEEDCIYGSIIEGCLKLAWDNGMCQQNYVGGAFVLHASVRKDLDWFKEDIPVKDAIKKKLHELIDLL